MTREYLTDEDYAEALSNGISRKQLSNRFNFHKWDKRRAITQPIGEKDKGFSDSRPKNEDFWYRVAKSKGMDPSTYNKRRKRGVVARRSGNPTTPVQ